MYYSNVRELRDRLMPDFLHITSDGRLCFDFDIFNIIAEIKDVYAGYGEHAVNRVIRVTLLAYYMYWCNHVAIKPNEIRQEELELLLILISASVYHATGGGNENDNRSRNTSYEVYTARWEPDEKICFLLECWPLSNEQALDELEILNYPEVTKLNVWELYCTLKAALALASCESDLDYERFKGIEQETANLDLFIDLAKSIKQPGWSRY